MPSVIHKPSLAGPLKYDDSKRNLWTHPCSNYKIHPTINSIGIYNSIIPKQIKKLSNPDKNKSKFIDKDQISVERKHYISLSKKNILIKQTIKTTIKIIPKNRPSMKHEKIPTQANERFGGFCFEILLFRVVVCVDQSVDTARQMQQIIYIYVKIIFNVTIVSEMCFLENCGRGGFVA